MRYLILLILFYSTKLHSQSSVYDIRFESLDSETIDMASFKGKKILVASVSPDNLQSGRMRVLDSLQQVYTNVVFLTVPSEDFGGGQNEVILQSIKNRASRKSVVTKSAKVKKSNKENQHALFHWLTNVSDNTHFDVDIATDEQIYIISESGMVYACLDKGVPLKLIDQLLKQQDVKE